MTDQSQSSGSNESSQQSAQEHPAAKPSKVEGEGSYSATRDYNERTREYLDKADVQADAQAAEPRSQDEAREMEEAEKQGRSHAKD